MSAKRLARMSVGGVVCLVLAVVAFGIRGTNPGYGSGSFEATIGLNLVLVLGGVVMFLAGLALLVTAIVFAVMGRR